MVVQLTYRQAWLLEFENLQHIGLQVHSRSLVGDILGVLPCGLKIILYFLLTVLFVISVLLWYIKCWLVGWLFGWLLSCCGETVGQVNFIIGNAWRFWPQRGRGQGHHAKQFGQLIHVCSIQYWSQMLLQSSRSKSLLMMDVILTYSNKTIGYQLLIHTKYFRFWCYKIVFGHTITHSDFFEFRLSNTRGHPYKLFKRRCCNTTRAVFFQSVWLTFGIVCHVILLTFPL